MDNDGDGYYWGEEEDGDGGGDYDGVADGSDSDHED